MVTGYEVQMYHNIERIAIALEKTAKALEDVAKYLAPAPTLTGLAVLDEQAPPADSAYHTRSSTYECPECHSEVDVRTARAL